VRAIAFSADGRRLLTGSADSSAILWGLSPAPDSVRLLGAVTDDDMWDRLAELPPTAYAFAWALASDPKRGVAVIEKGLARGPDTEQKILQWIKDQADPAFAKRDEAARQLRLRGSLVAPYLREALKGKHDLETRRRLEALLKTTEALGVSPERLRDERMLHVLEMIGTPEARRVLATLAKGPAGSPRTGGAKAALLRLEER
jgi:hypothetical protein